jgi:hypothetical protein
MESRGNVIPMKASIRYVVLEPRRRSAMRSGCCSNGKAEEAA